MRAQSPRILKTYLSMRGSLNLAKTAAGVQEMAVNRRGGGRKPENRNYRGSNKPIDTLGDGRSCLDIKGML